MSEYLPEEVLIEIFIKLPTKSNHSVHKRLQIMYSVITSPNFISIHLNNQHDDHLLVRNCSGKPAKEIYALYNENFDPYVQYDVPFEQCESHFNIVGSCNGILCLSDDLCRYWNHFYLWNPSIRKLVKLPKPIFTFETHGPFDHTLGFGYDPVANDYKVLRIVHVDTGGDIDSVSPYVELYKLSTRVWQDITHVAPCYKFHEQIPGVYVNGACHWVTVKWEHGESCNMMIVLFDMQDETFREMMLLDSFVVGFWFSVRWFNLFVSEESLCLANHLIDNDQTIDVWRMEYGHPESWVKQFSINRHITFNVGVVDELFSIFNGGRQRQVAHFLVKPIASRKNGQILWRANNGLLVSYNNADEKIENLSICNANFVPHHDALYVSTYKVSLLLLDRRADYFSGDTRSCEESIEFMQEEL